MAKNPFHPGVGTLPPYLAGRQPQIKRFLKQLDAFPQKRTNLRITGLRGVGKTVLLKKFESEARGRGWSVIRRDLSPRANDEAEMATFLSELLREAAEEMSAAVKAKNLLSDAMAAISEIQVELGDDVKVSLDRSGDRTTALENRIYKALVKVGALASKSGGGFALMLDEAHVISDRGRDGQWPLYALISAFVRAQDQEDPAVPVMLVLCGLPPLIAHLQAARSHSERFFKAENISNLSLASGSGGKVSEAAEALVNATTDGPIGFELSTADHIAAEVDGYPFFIQYFGEALWDAADESGSQTIDKQLHAATKRSIQKNLDGEFFDTRFRDVRAADQATLRVVASLGGEEFKVADLNTRMTSRTSNANAQSLNRLVNDDVIFRDQQGIYAYTAPLFGDFMRRRHPLQDGDC